MPKKTFVVEWDSPEDEDWMNVFNLKLALESYCPNTKFEITERGRIISTKPEEHHCREPLICDTCINRIEEKGI